MSQRLSLLRSQAAPVPLPWLCGRLAVRGAWLCGRLAVRAWPSPLCASVAYVVTTVLWRENQLDGESVAQHGLRVGPGSAAKPARPWAPLLHVGTWGPCPAHEPFGWACGLYKAPVGMGPFARCPLRLCPSGPCKGLPRPCPCPAPTHTDTHMDPDIYRHNMGTHRDTHSRACPQTCSCTHRHTYTHI